MPEENLTVYAIGLMSGTSADGIDGVVLEISGESNLSIHSTLSIDYPKQVKEKIRRMIDRKIIDAGQAENLDIELAQLYADVVIGLLNNLDRSCIAVVGCHGQTVHHSPDTDPPFSLQIGDGDELARLTKLPVVTDFRSADLNAGGQGAPLAPAFHQAAFASKDHDRCIVNIGGISNITFLSAEENADVIGYDVGPGNTFMDYWCRTHFDCDYDKGGDLAKQGTLRLDLLDIFLKDPYFDQPQPKSTGLEYFNQSWLNGKLAVWEGRDLDSSDQHTNIDVLTTLTALTARTVADQVNSLMPGGGAVYLCGGGAKNKLLSSLLARQVVATVETTATLGIDPQWIEAAAFAWMANRTLRGLTSTLPSVTGASIPTIAGVISQP
jgi:anhydro-N-acetylmuramic acid kinase